LSKKPRRVHNPATDRAKPLAREWVMLSDGTEVCCWQLTVGQTMHMARMSTLPDEAGGGPDAAALAFWQVVLSARTSDEEGAGQVWMSEHHARLLEMSAHDFATLLQAVAKVNGMDAERGAATEAFTAAGRGASPQP
jgi:hypothetical protein